MPEAVTSRAVAPTSCADNGWERQPRHPTNEIASGVPREADTLCDSRNPIRANANELWYYLTPQERRMRSSVATVLCKTPPLGTSASAVLH
jgi:hypothetical protein